jgi:tripartite-type tricarboxylate transporter receptor subunit TctC
MTHASRRRVVQAALGMAGLATSSMLRPTRAQDAVEKLKILCGYPPGGSADLVSRQVAERLIGTYAKSSLVDNRPGAAERLAVAALKSAPATGETMLLTPSSCSHCRRTSIKRCRTMSSRT